MWGEVGVNIAKTLSLNQMVCKDKWKMENFILCLHSSITKKRK